MARLRDRARHTRLLCWLLALNGFTAGASAALLVRWWEARVGVAPDAAAAPPTVPAAAAPPGMGCGPTGGGLRVLALAGDRLVVRSAEPGPCAGVEQVLSVRVAPLAAAAAPDLARGIPFTSESELWRLVEGLQEDVLHGREGTVLIVAE